MFIHKFIYTKKNYYYFWEFEYLIYFRLLKQLGLSKRLTIQVTPNCLEYWILIIYYT